jgi:hypothetical protein
VRVRLSLLLTALLAFAFVGCTASPVPDPPSPSVTSDAAARTATPTPSSTPTPAPTAARRAAIVVSVDGLTVVDADGATIEDLPYSDGHAIVDFFTAELGPQPETTPSPKYPSLVQRRWEHVVVSGSPDHRVSVWFDSPQVNDLTVRTASGITIGTTRTGALAAGAVEDPYDGLRFDVQDAPGTKALGATDEVGVNYVRLAIDADLVSNISAPGNNYSDL